MICPLAQLAVLGSNSQVRDKEKVRHAFRLAPEPLMTFASFAADGLHDANFGFVTENGPAAARQLLRYLTDLPAAAGCPSTEHFVLGHAGVADHVDKLPLKTWEELLARTFDTAKIEDLQGMANGTREFVDRFIPLIEDVGKFASPCLLAWGVLPDKT